MHHGFDGFDGFYLHDSQYCNFDMHSFCIEARGVFLLVDIFDSLFVDEPEQGDTVNIVACFSALVEESLGRPAVFLLELTNGTTATLGVDFFPNTTSPFLTIPATFSGTFVQCITVSVFGDSEEEGFEIIAYSLTALSELDRVATPLIVIGIEDNFGNYTKTHGAFYYRAVVT